MCYLHIYPIRIYVDVQRKELDVDDYLEPQMRLGASANHNHIRDRRHRPRGSRHAAVLGEGLSRERLAASTGLHSQYYIGAIG